MDLEKTLTSLINVITIEKGSNFETIKESTVLVYSLQKSVDRRKGPDRVLEVGQKLTLICT